MAPLKKDLAEKLSEELAKLKTPLEMLYSFEKNCPDRAFLKQSFKGEWKTFTYQKACDEIRRVASALMALNLPPGSHIAILSKNCAHWIMADLAIWMSGHVSVPIYPNLNASSIRSIIDHSEAKAIFVGRLDQWATLAPAIPSNIFRFSFPFDARDSYVNWDELVAIRAPLEDSPTRSISEIATLIYTSGTTGQPKGVMHAFQSFAFAGTEIAKEVPVTNKDSFFSYLPLAHAAERIVCETASLYSGAVIHFADSLETFKDDLKVAEPTIFLSVPRLWSKFQSGLLSKMPQETFDFLLGIPFVASFFKRQARKMLGLGKSRVAVSGAAPMPESLVEWFKKIGLQIQDAYGMTENLAYSHFTRKNHAKAGYIGQPWYGVEVKLSTSGEVLVKSPCNMLGYFKEPEMTKEIFTDDGFLKTGDLGSIDADGSLRITGRAKDLFKTSKGKYVAPVPIELSLSSGTQVEQVLVVGSGLPSPIALMVLASRVKESDEMGAQLKSLMKEVNRSLDAHERLAKVIVVKDKWSLENGLLTPTMKAKRSLIEERYGSSIKDWASRKESVIWE